MMIFMSDAAVIVCGLESQWDICFRPFLFLCWETEATWHQACTAAAYCSCSLTGGPTTNCLPGLWSWCEKFAWPARCNTPKLSTLEFRWNWSLVALDYIILTETFKVRGVSSLIVFCNIVPLSAEKKVTGNGLMDKLVSDKYPKIMEWSKKR